MRSRNNIATAIAILFHVVGLTGILFFDQQKFAALTPLNLLLMFALVLWTQQEKTISFWLFFAGCFIEGIIVEVIGVHTGIVFGNYQYGDQLGPKIYEVPWIIGFNWFLIIYGCGVIVTRFSDYLIRKIPEEEQGKVQAVYHLSVLLDGALLAVFFDWVMEPVAVKLGFWKWNESPVPFRNYFCWLLVSMVMLLLFRKAVFDKLNQFAVNLLLIQLMFFLLLRTFL
jgi:putative membrane protein